MKIWASATFILLLGAADAMASQTASAVAKIDWQNIRVLTSTGQIASASDYYFVSPTSAATLYTLAQSYPFPSSSTMTLGTTSTAGDNFAGTNGSLENFKSVAVAKSGSASAFQTLSHESAIPYLSFSRPGAYTIEIPYSLSVVVSGLAEAGEKTRTSASINMSIGQMPLGGYGGTNYRLSQSLNASVGYDNTNGSPQLTTAQCDWTCGDFFDLYSNGVVTNAPNTFSGVFSASINSADWGNAVYLGNTTRATAINFTAAVPEPETYAMMLAGLGLFGVMTRRRRNQLG